jgi:hypothetical protein
MNFESLIGKTVPAIIPMIHPKELRELTIRGVDFGGLWVEGRNLPMGSFPNWVFRRSRHRFSLCPFTQ